MESTNFKLGKRVNTLEELYDLSLKHKSVFDVDAGLKPARAILNQQAYKLIKKIKRGGVCVAVRK